MSADHFFHLVQAFSLLQVFIIVLFLGHILRVRKTPSSTLAWFFLVLIQPMLGVMLYLIFGSRKIKPRREKYKRSRSQSAADPVQRLLLSNGSAPCCGNKELRLLKNGEDAFQELCEFISSARHSICLESFIFSSDASGARILNLLTQKASEGVDVRILVDAFGTLLKKLPDIRDFKKKGGKIRKFMPLLHWPFRGRANLRNHRKFIVIDHTKAIMGGMNIALEYMGETPHALRWIDLGVAVEGPLAQQMEEIFWEDWTFTSGENNTRQERQGVPSFSHEHMAQLVASGPDIASDPIYEWLLTTLYMAKKRIWIATPYFIPDESLARALELAAKRGVDVRLLIPENSNHLLADLGRKTYLDQIQSGGVKVYLYPKMIHAKLSLIDGEYGLISSANFDSRSLLINYELGISLYSKSDLHQLEEWSLSLFRESRLGVERASIGEQWIGGIARLLSPLI